MKGHAQLGGERESVSSDGHGSSYFSGERPSAAGAAPANASASAGGQADDRTVTLMEPVFPSSSPPSRAASGALAAGVLGLGPGTGSGSSPAAAPPRPVVYATSLRHVDSLGVLCHPTPNTLDALSATPV